MLDCETNPACFAHRIDWQQEQQGMTRKDIEPLIGKQTRVAESLSDSLCCVQHHINSNCIEGKDDQAVVRLL